MRNRRRKIMMTVMVAALSYLAALGALAGPVSATDWPQFQHNAANHGRAPRAVEPPYQLRWVWYGEENVAAGGRPFPAGEAPRPPRESIGLLSFTMHGVVADRRVVFGDLRGRLYCLRTADGSTVWTRRFPGAFLHAAAIFQRRADPRENIVVAPCQDGRIYGLDWEGKTRWTVQAARPFATPAKLDGSTCYIGALDGVLYAVDIESGVVRWRFDAGAAIRQPAAIAEGHVFFGSEDMVFHALDASSGRRIWRTAPGTMTGQSFRNTWPVVAGDKVMTFQVLINGLAEFVMEALLFNATPGNHKEKRLEDWPKEREAILAWLAGDRTWALDCNKGWQEDPGRVHPGSRGVGWAGGPTRKTFWVFDVEGDGEGHAREPFQVPMGIVGGTGNANMGLVLDAEGRPITWWRVSARSIIPGGSFGTSFSPDLSGLDLATGDRVILPTTREPGGGGPGMEIDNHHMLTSAGEYIYYFNPFRQARWVRLDGRRNPTGTISAVYGRHDGGGWSGDVVYYPTKADAGERAARLFDSHGAARTPVVIADDALFVNEIDIRAFACYETRGAQATGPVRTPEHAREASAPIRSDTAARDPTPAEAEDPPADPRECVWEKRVVTDVPQSDAASRLRARLAGHVRDMVEAGHLLPYYTNRGEHDPRWYFTDPGDTVAALSRALPYLPEELRPRVRAYLAKEIAAYPPWSERLNAPEDEGTSRHDFEVPEHWRDWEGGRLYARLPRAHNVYSTWLYADATGDRESIEENWPAIREFYARHRDDLDAGFGGPSAAIGLARLAQYVGDEATKAAAVDDALRAFAAANNDPQTRTAMAERYGFRPGWQEEFAFAGFHLLHLTPEVARHVRQRDALRASVLDLAAAATLHWPMWFVSQASAFTRYYGESHALPPDYSAMLFPVKALIERAPAEQLRVWVDAEDAPRGDLFFIERVVLALEAHGRETWVDVRGSR